jgi:hypothetical protein
MGHIGNTVSIVIVQQHLDRCVETDIRLCAYCIATAVLVTVYSIGDEIKGYKTPVVIS